MANDTQTDLDTIIHGELTSRSLKESESNQGAEAENLWGGSWDEWEKMKVQFV